VSFYYNTLILITKYRYSEKSFNYARPQGLVHASMYIYIYIYIDIYIYRIYIYIGTHSLPRIPGIPGIPGIRDIDL
jgi:hypothetical protein